MQYNADCYYEYTVTCRKDDEIDRLSRELNEELVKNRELRNQIVLIEKWLQTMALEVRGRRLKVENDNPY